MSTSDSSTSFAYTISARSRKKKFEQFLTLVKPQPHETIIDVGVNIEEYSATDNYLEKFYAVPQNITAVGQGDVSDFAQRYPLVTVLSGDGRSLPFTDNQFDMVYSNAVIEHVIGFAEQQQFLSELYRVARRGYMTTPNRWFPVELHTRVPFAHLVLPKPLFYRFLRLIGKGWATADYMDLLSRRRLVRLLHAVGITDYRIIPNRFFGWPMTYTVIWAKTV